MAVKPSVFDSNEAPSASDDSLHAGLAPIHAGSARRLSAGHMVAAWCDGGEVLFMEPNMGEFWLPSKKAFDA